MGGPSSWPTPTARRPGRCSSTAPHRATSTSPTRPTSSSSTSAGPDTCSTRWIPRRPPLCASCISGAARGRCPGTSRPPAPARRSVSWNSTVRWSTWCAPGCPPTGWASMCTWPTPVPGSPRCRRARSTSGARRVRRRPDPRAPHLGGVPAAGRTGAAPGRVLRREPRRRHGRPHVRPADPARLRPRRPRPPRLCSRRWRSSRPRTCCTAAGSATSCSSPEAGTPELPLDEVARRVAADPFPARVEPGEAFASTAAVVTDRTAVPSPRPPRGLFGAR